jgi:DNA invertase Pin-like site-specific DNA recombinase
MKAAIYARVSTNHQGTDLQLSDVRNYCNRRGWEIVREYVDIGISGTKEKRPELDELLKHARRRYFDAVVVWRFDRFARSTRHLLSALEEFKSLGIQFISYQENIDTSSPMGQALFTMVSAVAQLERDLIRERVTAGVRNARAKGKRLGRPRRIKDAALVASLRKAGKSYREIAASLGVSTSTVHAVARKASL